MAMIALTRSQPTASLVAHSVARWITTPRPIAESRVGVDLALCSGARRPETEGWFGDFQVVGGPGTCEPDRFWLEAGHLDGIWRRRVLDYTAPLPLSSVVAVVRLEPGLPIEGPSDVGECSGDPHVCWLPNDDKSVLALLPTGETRDISDQLPLADWTPGHWAYPIESVRAVTVPLGSGDRPSGGIWELSQATTDAVMAQIGGAS